MSYMDALAKCPFYLGVREMSISCEGLKDGFKHMLRFKNADTKSCYFNKYCASYAYRKCPYFEAQERRF